MKSKPGATTVPLVVFLTLGTAFGGGTAGSSFATSSAPAVQRGTGTRSLARNDREFIIKAVENAMHELEVSRLAASKARDPAVKTFATMLVEHHTQANDELKNLASAKGVELPVAPPEAKRNEAEKLGKMTKAKFEQEYRKVIGAKDHQKDIKDFEKAGKKARDPELKAWVDKTLPTLKEHMAQAQKIPTSKG